MYPLEYNAACPMFDSECNLAAVVYSRGDDPDRLVLDFARELCRSGVKVVGAIQLRDASTGGHTAIRVMVLPDGNLIELGHEQHEGQCLLKTEALSCIADMLAISIARGTDLVVINRFGELEMHHRGFSGLIKQAVDLGIAVLTVVAEHNFPACVEYCGGMNVRLPCRRAALDQWWKSQKPMLRIGATTFCDVFK
jgi:nucleoside-triphosphatase THEP1